MNCQIRSKLKYLLTMSFRVKKLKSRWKKRRKRKEKSRLRSNNLRWLRRRWWLMLLKWRSRNVNWRRLRWSRRDSSRRKRSWGGRSWSRNERWMRSCNDRRRRKERLKSDLERSWRNSRRKKRKISIILDLLLLLALAKASSLTTLPPTTSRLLFLRTRWTSSKLSCTRRLSKNWRIPSLRSKSCEICTCCQCRLELDRCEWRLKDTNLGSTVCGPSTLWVSLRATSSCCVAKRDQAMLLLTTWSRWSKISWARNLLHILVRCALTSWELSFTYSTLEQTLTRLTIQMKWGLSRELFNMRLTCLDQKDPEEWKCYSQMLTSRASNTFGGLPM